jgi:hypothetical protein
LDFTEAKDEGHNGIFPDIRSAAMHSSARKSINDLAILMVDLMLFLVINS